ncbi:MAG TPA: ThiF family adenylyltransferase [Candidatus Angelobacter sp.]
MNTITPTASLPELNFELLEDRYSRQRLIASWDQDKVAKARILVAGAGALGNEVLKNVALIGIGSILIIDFDRVEISNLSRSVLFREEDIGEPKAATAARALQRLNPDIDVSAIDGDLECDLGLGQLGECDLVLGCLDSIHARWVLNRACQRAGRPWINAGINATVGEVCTYAPQSGPCYECGMTQQMWQQIHQRRSCMLLPKKLPLRTIPTTSVIASLTAALQVNEALKRIHGEQQLSPGEMLLLSLEPYALSSFSMVAKRDCLAHEIYSPSVSLDAPPDEITVAKLLARIPDAIVLHLDFDILESWLCRQCGEEPVGRRLAGESGKERSCPQCNSERTPQLVHEIRPSDWLAGRSLAALGVPIRAILRVGTTVGIQCVELTG